MPDIRIPRRAAATLVVAAVLPSLPAVAASKLCRDCATLSSVKNAAGTEDKVLDALKRAVSAIAFEGDALAASAAAQVRQIARDWGAQRAGVLEIKVKADAGLDAAKARAQGAARAAALRQALVGAGVPAERLRIDH